MTESAEACLASCPDPEEERAGQEQLPLTKHIGTPEEVAYTTARPPSDEARLISATDIMIDGGRAQTYHDQGLLQTKGLFARH